MSWNANEFPLGVVAVSSAGYTAAPSGPVHIGAPLPGVGMYVLDGALRPVPDHTVGELYLSGNCLARGYLDDPATTAGAFVPDPFSADPFIAGGRMYRTGDLVRWRRRSGRWTLDFLGRSDFQVKIRGFRIELGEIDAVLGEHPGVDFSTTAGIEHPTSGETVLVSWVHGVAGAAPDTADVATHAARRLPAHMVPTVIVPIDDIRELAARLPTLWRLVEASSLFGHDAFLKEDALVGDILRTALKDISA